MRIKYKASFIKRLEEQIEYIAQYNPERATQFKDELLAAINNIPSKPFKHRKSIYFNDPQIRDMVFKGYTIVFRVKKNQIEVFGFVKYRQSPAD